LSPGAKPTQPKVSGVGLEKLFTLRTVEDTFRIKDYINANKPKSAVLAGGGFISLELAENLRELGMDVTIVQRPKQLMNPFDSDMAAFIHSEVRKHGVKLALGYTVEGFEESEGGVKVLLKDAAPLQADMVVLAIGVTPESELAKTAGLELGVKGSILVNDRMETSVPHIYAVGDAVQVKHFVSGEDTVIPLAGPANKQGRIAADNICGGDSRYTGTQGTSVAKIFSVTAASTGLNMKNAAMAIVSPTEIAKDMGAMGIARGTEITAIAKITETMATDRTTETMATDRTTETMTIGRTTETMATDRTTETMATDRTTETMATDRTTETMATDRTTETMVIGRTTETMAIGKDMETMAIGRDMAVTAATAIITASTACVHV